jgi:hypothetical protein
MAKPITWAELNALKTWQDVDYTDVPKFATRWNSDLTELAADEYIEQLVQADKDNE